MKSRGLGVVYKRQVENLGIFEKGTEGVERRKNIKGLAEKRLVEKMLFHYLVGRNVWFYFREMTIM